MKFKNIEVPFPIGVEYFRSGVPKKEVWEKDLIEIKKSLNAKSKRMIICNISDSIWSTMLATGLDQVFEFIENTPVALASLTFEE